MRSNDLCTCVDLSFSRAREGCGSSETFARNCIRNGNISDPKFRKRAEQVLHLRQKNFIFEQISGFTKLLEDSGQVY